LSDFFEDHIRGNIPIRVNIPIGSPGNSGDFLLIPRQLQGNREKKSDLPEITFIF
jgi:hypothetical protein